MVDINSIISMIILNINDQNTIKWQDQQSKIKINYVTYRKLTLNINSYIDEK